MTLFEANAPDQDNGSLEDLRDAARTCTRCRLYANATQTVFGEGSRDAPLVFVGEQPGDKEDLQGRPFVGPAGKLFDACLEEAGLARDQAYVTNAVKHFKFEPRGKFRLHKKPNGGEIAACKWWLAGELKLLRPKVIVALGGTATQALTGNGQGILKRRGQVEQLEDGSPLFITVHPSSLLRLPDENMQVQARAHFVRDLGAVKDLLQHAA
jgi:uracil-DNA glycosylase